MDIQEVREAKVKMEDTIRTAVDAAVSEFIGKTGLLPTAIQVEFIDASTWPLRGITVPLLGKVHAEVLL